MNTEVDKHLELPAAMLLSAGRGERMRPLTDTLPKPLVKVGDKTLIEWHLQALHNAGVRRVVINHAHLGEQIVALLGNGHRYGLEINYSAEPLGGLETAGGIMQALPLLGEAPFVVVNADIWTDYNFALLATKLGAKLGADLGADLGAKLGNGILAHLVLVDTPTFKSQGDFFLDDKGMVNRCGNGKSLTFAGVSLQSPQLFAGFKAGRLALLPVLQKAIEQNKISGEHYRGEWSDIGTLQRLTELQSKF